MQYNIAVTDSISSSDVFAWTSVQNIIDSLNTGDVPGIGGIHVENPSDTITINDTPTVAGNTGYSRSFTETINVSDVLTTFHDGMLNTNMLNTRLISVGSLEALRDNVTIT